MKQEKEIAEKIKYLKSELEDICSGKYGFRGMASIEKMEGYIMALEWVIEEEYATDANGNRIKKV